MKKITPFISNFAFLVLLFLSSVAFSQSGIVKGKVTDSNGIGIPGANVSISSKNTATDLDGNYTITAVATGQNTITISYIGFKTSQIAVNVTENTIANVTLESEENTLEEIVITGVASPKAKIKSSVSITTLDVKQIEQSAPRSTAEIFRTIPGIRSESSGGEGNANIAVRGVPISSGGSKYLQLQEDGLPVLLFGDISFATADIFTRFDRNISKVEAIRGGSASTLASNSPGGIINFISKTGKVECGSMVTSFGVDYNTFRTDLEYGAKIGDGLYFHAGGFYRTGEGVRSPGFVANNGGQVKFNITKEFEKGSVTIYTKFLDDRAIAYLPMPVQVSGTNADPKYSNVSGYDATSGTLQSIYLTSNVGLGGDGQVRQAKVNDGMHPVSKSIGASINFDLEDGWKVSNNGRFSANSGQFISPFPSQVADAATIADSFDPGATLTFANSGTPFNNPNGLVARIHMFDTKLNNFNNFMNDLRITKRFEDIKLGITGGFFKSIQNVSMTWQWNSYLQEVSDNNPRLLNVTDSAGNLLSQNGLYAYGTPFWGNLARNYDTQYNVSAPYLNIALDATDKLNVEGGIRYDRGKVSGSFAGGVSTTYDINNDGAISVPEQNVFAIDTANETPVDYTYDYVSYTLGANYLLDSNQSLFARHSKGASAKADRILFAGLNYLDGDQINARDFLTQTEVGYKKRFSKGYVYATIFASKTSEEGGFEASTNTIRKNDFKSYGLELESAYNINREFNFRGALTYTKAEITTGTDEGNEPRRQPKLMYNVIPTYTFAKSKSTIGLSFIGQTKAFAQDSNELVMNGFVIINGFVEFGITKGLSLNVSGNNLFDTLAITESEEGSITENTNNVIRARPLPGRSISAALTYSF